MVYRFSVVSYKYNVSSPVESDFLDDKSSPTSLSRMIASSVIDLTFVPAPNSSLPFDPPIVFMYEIESTELKVMQFVRICFKIT